MRRNGVEYEPAAIIATEDDNIDGGGDNMSLTSKQQTKKNKKFSSSKQKTSSPKKKSSKKQSYVMINEDLSDDDLSDQEIDDSKHTNGTISTTTNKRFQIAENSDDETEISDLEDIELNIDNTEIELTQGQHSKNKNKEHRYGTSAYYGLRLNYDHTKWHYVGWAILFILHCIAILIVLSLVWSSAKVSMPHAQSGLFILFFLLAFAIIYSFVWTFMLRYCGGGIVWILIIANLIFICAFAAFCFIASEKFYGLGIIFIFLFVCFAFFTLLIRKKISYTIALLQLGSSILIKTPSALFVAFGVLMCQILWMFVWGSIAIAWAAQYPHINESSAEFGIVLVLFLLSFVWNHQIIKNIGHTTICAITTHWYFSPHSSYPTWKAFRRCLSTSLGSIVFGSMFVNILTAIRAYLRIIRDEIGCCSTKMNGCFEGNCLEYYNQYAFVHVALYNSEYKKAGKDTYDMLSSSSIYQLVNSNFTEYALLCGAICGGIMNSILASWIANSLSFEIDWVVIFTCFGFMIGMSLSSSLLNAVSSCVVALLVCFAEEPNVLIEFHPEQHLRFDGAKNGIA